MKRRTASTRHQGASLIEVLVGLTIGLIILVALGAAYLNVTNITRQREDQAQMNDPARMVMRMLRQNLLHAGYVDLFDQQAAHRSRAASLFIAGNPVSTNLYVRDPDPALGTISAPLSVFFPGLTPVFGCDGAMNGTPHAMATTTAPITQNCGTANATRHTLQIAYQAVPSSPTHPGRSLSAANTTTGEGLDCLQQGPPQGVTVVINRFMAPAPSAGTVSQLRCAGSGAKQTQDIAAGVEEFVLRYQMAAPGVAASRVAAGAGQSRYMSATEVTASSQGWAGVTAVEVCMVSATLTANGAAAQGTVALQTYRPTCQRSADGGFIADIQRTAGDTRLWKRFTSVVSLRNAVYASPF
jgi:type IV pilus assembly protein PilW